MMLFPSFEKGTEISTWCLKVAEYFDMPNKKSYIMG